jgi:small GTP-binding protein
MTIDKFVVLFSKLENSMLKFSVKVVICGDYAVGKTTFVLSFLDGDKNLLDGYKPTIGVDIGRKSFVIQPYNVIFQLWDLSGQQSFITVRKQFYNRSDGGILIFDVTRRESFNNLKTWLSEITEQAGNIPIILVANKIDLGNRNVSTKEGKDFATKITQETGLETPYIEASAINRHNNLDPFITLGKILLNNRKQ